MSKRNETSEGLGAAAALTVRGRPLAGAAGDHDHGHEHAHEHGDHSHGGEAPSSWALDRRSFLKLAGFSFAGAALAACEEAPVYKAIPYLAQPEAVVPGRASWYATTCAGCSAGCGVLAKQRDGRPIKLEGNPQHPLSRGGLCAVGQAVILGLYDAQRLRGPLAGGKDATWEQVDQEVMGRLEQVRRQGGAVRFLTGTVTSPTAQAAIDRFLASFADGRHVQYDPLSASAILDAHELTHGRRVLPRYRFERARAIASFDADFLGTWLSPVEFTAGYRAGRTLEGNPPKASWHLQVEPRLSLTGTNADRRLALLPHEIPQAMLQLAHALAGRAGAALPLPAAEAAPLDEETLREVAEHLWQARGEALVVCGINDLSAQLLAAALNHLLDAYGTTVDLEQPSRQALGSDPELAALLAELEAGKVAALFVHGVNPAYDLPQGGQVAQWIGQVPLSVSFAERADETGQACGLICPDHHFLEAWRDAEPVAGELSLTQPAMRPLGQTRGLTESLAAWQGQPAGEREMLQAHWREAIFPRQGGAGDFQAFWDRAVHDGCATVASRPSGTGRFQVQALRQVRVDGTLAEGAMALVLYPKIGLRDGHHAHNPWLQELPDPVSKVVWDNYACLSPNAAALLKVREGDVVRLTVANSAGKDAVLELPVLIQPGQHDRVVAVALGYGREGTDRFAAVGPQWLEGKPTVEAGGLVGRNAAGLLALAEGHLRYAGRGVAVTPAGRRHELASTQRYDALDLPEHLAPPGARRRPVVRQTTLEEYRRDPAAGTHAHGEEPTLWAPDHKYPKHHWGMAIDLNACTGCGGCVLSCQAENNIPVVGRDEVRRSREMHWIRIDRYYLEQGQEVETVHQPMLCQQCDNAPCESVCPVLATVHSSEGLNQQVYNRCVGTRYCANNCPYKMRRFNWFDYAHEDRLQNMVLNPDVTIRSRGVMEKCTFCVQRIQLAKAEAKRRGEPVQDGDIQTACQQSCPAGAIIFGDLNNPESELVKRLHDPRHYYALAELNVLPSVGYLTKVRHRPPTDGESVHG